MKYIKYHLGSGAIVGVVETADFIPFAETGMGLISYSDYDAATQYVSPGRVLAARQRGAPKLYNVEVGTRPIAPNDADWIIWGGVLTQLSAVTPIDGPGEYIVQRAGAKFGPMMVTVIVAQTPETVQSAGVSAIDDLAKALSMSTMTGGFIKAQMYEEQSREVVLFQSVKGTLLTLTSATAQFPALMAMVAVWNPEATTGPAKLAALAVMATKVEAGIAKSRPYLRKLNAIAVFGKEQLRAASTVTAKRAVIDATTAKLNSTTP